MGRHQELVEGLGVGITETLGEHVDGDGGRVVVLGQVRHHAVEGILVEGLRELHLLHLGEVVGGEALQAGSLDLVGGNCGKHGGSHYV